MSVARKLLSAANRLQKLAELECSSERADHDRVMCPGNRVKGGMCCCDMMCSTHRWDYSMCLSSCQRVHTTVPRIAVQAQRIERHVTALCASHGLISTFGGDPRGCILTIQVPSGWVNNWGRVGIAVPSCGYTSAQMERMR